MGLAPDRLNYQVLNDAFRILSPEDGSARAQLIATHKALYYRSSDGGLSLGPGASGPLLVSSSVSFSRCSNVIFSLQGRSFLDLKKRVV